MPKSKYQKRLEAEQRAQQRSERSVLGQLLRLDSLLGPDHGAQRERARLQAQLRSQRGPDS